MYGDRCANQWLRNPCSSQQALKGCGTQIRLHFVNYSDRYTSTCTLVVDKGSNPLATFPYLHVHTDASAAPCWANEKARVDHDEVGLGNVVKWRPDSHPTAGHGDCGINNLHSQMCSDLSRSRSGRRAPERIMRYKEAHQAVGLEGLHSVWRAASDSTESFFPYWTLVVDARLVKLPLQSSYRVVQMEFLASETYCAHFRLE